ncbi:hypothetical protein [Sulfitobacter sediminilitoris]|uniref:hypothetical protein n=1 Tax=Sulfitobacter sediminilitoris TaxID=2698830 RepID=UPI00360A7117
MRYGRLTDLVRLALQMQGRADGLSLDDIGESYEVSRRTAERMRDALRDAFPQIEEISEPGVANVGGFHLGQRADWLIPPSTILQRCIGG